MTYPIERAVPPPARLSRLNAERATIRRMKVGDSFVAPPEREQAARQAASDESHTGRKFTARKQEDGRIRVWRLA